MRFQCPQCRHTIEIEDTLAGQTIVCQNCQARLKAPSLTALAPQQRPPEPAPLPVVVVRPTDLQSLEEEQLERQERREDRIELRRDRQEEREFNQQGVAGFALAVTSLVFVAVAFFYRKPEGFDFWSGMFNCFSVPVTIAGFICSLVGVLAKRSTDKKLAIVGLVISGVLLGLMPFYVGWR
jgi:hypothetical protein